jgi:hypothetical protein
MTKSTIDMSPPLFDSSEFVLIVPFITDLYHIAFQSAMHVSYHTYLYRGHAVA